MIRRFLTKLFFNRTGVPLTENDLRDGTTYEVLCLSSTRWYIDGVYILLFLREKGKKDIKICKIRGDKFGELFRDLYPAGKLKFDLKEVKDLDLLASPTRFHFIKNGSEAEVL